MTEREYLLKVEEAARRLLEAANASDDDDALTDPMVALFAALGDKQAEQAMKGSSL